MNGHRFENSRLRPVFLLALSLSTCVQGCGGTSNVSDDGPILRECPGFTNIVNGTFARDGDELTWTLELEAIPERFLLNQTSVPDNGGEYGWEVELDGDRDGVHELSVSVQRFKFAGNPQEWTSDILRVTSRRRSSASGERAFAMELRSTRSVTTSGAPAASFARSHERLDGTLPRRQIARPWSFARGAPVGATSLLQ